MMYSRNSEEDVEKSKEQAQHMMYPRKPREELYLRSKSKEEA